MVEALTPELRSSLAVDLGFLSEPVLLLTALGMRLNEVANHLWDVRVAFDLQAGVNADSAAVLVDLLAGQWLHAELSREAGRGRGPRA